LRMAMCVFIAAVPITKMFAWGGGNNGEYVLDYSKCAGENSGRLLGPPPPA